MSLNPRVSNWADQIVWLVGASSGIGRATAELLHDAGATVVVSARNAALLAQFTQGRDRALALPLDVTEAAGLRDAAERVIARYGRVDRVVYCAGYYRPLRATAFDLAEMLKHQQVNLTGALYTLDAVLPQLQEQAMAGRPAHVSLVASVAGYRGLPNALAYGPTKAALINLAESLYLDLHPKGVGVSVINPGFVETPLTAGNEFKMPALITPAEAAREIVAGWEAGRFEIHFPKRFTLWLKALQWLGDGAYFAVIRRSTGL
jgi:NAD(P)-dependent dehydrogenase (short-subunit alcohol dehydrogenase family)